MGSADRPYHTLRHREFGLYAGGMLVSLVASHMQNAAIDWHVWTLTRSPLLLGTVGLVRVVRIVAFSLLGGLVADRFDRRRVLLGTQAVMMAAAEAVEPPLAALRQGLRFVFLSPLIVTTMVLDFVATFFSGSMSLLPIFADRVLGVGPVGYGWLRAAPGLADTISTVIRQTVRSLATPDALRGRMTGVNMLFFQGGPQLVELEAGLVASLFASAAGDLPPPR